MLHRIDELGGTQVRRVRRASVARKSRTYYRSCGGLFVLLAIISCVPSYQPVETRRDHCPWRREARGRKRRSRDRDCSAQTARTIRTADPVGRDLDRPHRADDRGIAKTVRIGLAWMTTDKEIIWLNGMTGGYASFIGFTAKMGDAASSSLPTLP